jgi:flagellar biosynthesis/type III secretory pathway M-ring protein FliF/YscJ
MPHTTLDWFSLLGCITAVYIVARLVIKIIYRLVCRAIEKREAENRDDNYADDSDNG